MQKYADVVLDLRGNVIGSASVLVKRRQDGNIATIYAQNGTQRLPNPMQTNNLGEFAFYAANGRYDVEIYQSGVLVASRTDIILDDPADASPVNVNGGNIANAALTNVTIDGKAPAYKEDTDALDSRVDDLEAATAGPGGLAERMTAAEQDIVLLEQFDADLANASDPAKGAALLPFVPGLAYPAGSVGHALNSLSGFIVNVRANGAKGGGVTDDTAAIRASIAVLKMAGGGTLYFPQGKYKVATSDENMACLWIDFDNVRITGDGYMSQIFTASNSHVPIHVSSQESLATPVATGAVIDGFVCENIHIQGTGVYEYFALAKGRGILIRRAKNCIVRNNFVTGMSMIGICTESGQGYFDITGNRIKDCKYTAINYNGRAYNSIIAGNICSGSNAGVNSLAIQATGPCIIKGNTVYGDVTNFANCGGIGWGEGPYDGIGTIQGNLVLHCRFGIKAVYHGACNISGNVLINCRTTGGINAVGGTAGGFTVASADNLIANNLMVNCAPYQIECSAAGSMITGNQCLNLSAPTAPSANTEPDYIAAVTVQAGIRVRAENCSITNNSVNGAVRGIVTTLGQTDGAISGNVVRNTSSAPFAWEGDSGVFVTAPARERISLGGTSFLERVVSGSIPGSGYFPSASRWNPSSYTLGQPTGAVVLQSRIDAVAITAGAGSTAVDIVGSANFVSGTNSKVGLKLDNNQYHWTTISANTGNTLTMAAAIPAGRSAPAGNPVYVTVWRPEANLA